MFRIFLIGALFAAPLPSLGQSAGATSAGAAEKKAKTTEHAYKWILDKREIGRTTIRCATDATTVTLRTQWSYSARGREHQSSGETVLDAASLKPKSFIQTSQAMISGGVGAAVTVESKVVADQLQVRANFKSALQTHDIELYENSYIYADQALEHVVVLAKIFTSCGPGEYRLVRPLHDESLVAKVTKGKSESVMGRPATAWTLTTNGLVFKAWIASDGTLLRYRQGELLIEKTNSDRLVLPVFDAATKAKQAAKEASEKAEKKGPAGPTNGGGH